MYMEKLNEITLSEFDPVQIVSLIPHKFEY